MSPDLVDELIEDLRNAHQASRVPDSHFYFQAPGGQCFRLVGISEDLSKYEGVGKGPNVEKVKEAVRRL